MGKNQGAIYTLTNPSFPDYVKIGYADDVENRLKELNKSECIPFAFRLYAYYKVPHRLTDVTPHQTIVKLNLNLRSIDECEGKTRTREFSNMSPTNACFIIKSITQINGSEGNRHLVRLLEKEAGKEGIAKENKILAIN